MKNSKKKWIKRIYYHIFPFGLLVYYGMTYKEIKKDLPKRIPKEAHKEIKKLNYHSDAKTYMFSTGQTVIVLEDKSPCTIAHEAFHAADLLLRRIGLSACKETDEVYAYMIGYIVGEITTKNPDVK